MRQPVKLLFRALLLLIVLLVAAVVYARYIEPHRLTVSHITVEHNNPPADFESLTVAVFSDTHFGPYYTLKQFEDVRDAINEREPDLILFCGDLIDNYGAYDGDVAEISDALDALNARIGKFAVYGNHDHGGGARRVYEDIMEDGGFTVLVNEALALSDLNITLIGFDDFIFGEASTEAAAAAREDHLNIVFCHEPDIADLLAAHDIDFMVAGHTHGGQIGYPHIFFPPYGQIYQKGAYALDNDRGTRLYVNAGIGTTKLPFRFMAPPEILFVTIEQGRI